MVSSLASRLARLDRKLTPEDRESLRQAAGGQALADIAGKLVEALDPDVQIEAARLGQTSPGEAQLQEERSQRLRQAILREAFAGRLLGGGAGWFGAGRRQVL